MSTPEDTSTRRWQRWDAVGAAFAAASAVGVAVLAATNHPHRAVLLLIVTLLVLAVQRALWPVRTWFASRARWFDVAALVGAALVIWYLSPYTATMAA